MNRKDFLSSVSMAGLALPLGHPGMEEPETAPMLPPYLKPGDTIAITSPAGYSSFKEIEPSVQQIKSWGFDVKIGATIGKRHFTFGGTDEERLNDFQQLLDDRSVKAILCARGGYGFVRIIDQLNFTRFKLHPKWLIGFSDITVLHSHLNRNLGIASIHSKMCNSFPEDWSKAEPIQVETILSIRDALQGVKMKYTAPFNTSNHNGTAEGILAGGNLKTIESLAGSKSDLRTTGKILFVEDTGEYLYSIDRMFWNLKRSGKLDHLAGLIVGGFKLKKDEGENDTVFGKTIEEIVLEKVKEFKYPVCFDFPVGHQKNNYALKCGVKHKLQISNEKTLLTEL
ncbi:LD-carboxypeptidase [Lacibacter sp. MH-610]|uniref:S66 peptidase family protein n=1 Tax=Lacibacter sp. MH-610 TaxID=3020883 RepID=UPI003891348D